MIRRILAAILLGAAASFAGAGERVVAGTWNVRNFALLDRYEEGVFRLQYPMPEERKQAIRRLILETRPAILFLQEVGSPAFLRELQLDLAAEGFRYEYSVFSGYAGFRAGLAVLSLFPLQEVILHDPDSPNSVKRGVQEVAIRIESILFRFFHVHLKSRYSTDPQDPEARLIRMAELHSLKAFLECQIEARPNTPLVLLGDFNTPFHDPLLAPLAEDWQALPARDAANTDWTYFHHRSASHERLDGFWFPRNRPAPMLPARILPLSHEPSDHRLLLAPLIFP